MVAVILTDIEGTTTSIAFVTDTLFPFARERISQFVNDHSETVANLILEVKSLEKGDPVANLERWSDEDRKITPLKTLQGMIWAEGYADGRLKGHVYPDAAEAMRRWHAKGKSIVIFSSGSVAAQKLIFGHSDQGDLTPLISGYFDTTTGPKREATSYRAIAAALALPPADILFLSDTPEEVAAAREAGMQALRVDRGDGAGDVASFDEITI